MTLNLTIPDSQNTVFLTKKIVSTVAIIGEVVRVWDNTPNQAIVPCEDADGGKFELVLNDTRKEMFEAIGADMARTQATVSVKGKDEAVQQATLNVTGYWNKRMWKKTRSKAPGWGHTWQLFVSEFSFKNTDGSVVTLGETPKTTRVEVEEEAA